MGHCLSSQSRVYVDEESRIPQSETMDQSMRSVASVALFGSVDYHKVLVDMLSCENLIIDLCCGKRVYTPIVFNTMDIQSCPEMLVVARDIKPVSKIKHGQAARWGKKDCCDVSTIYFALHECSRTDRARVIANAMRIARKGVIVVGVASTFKPENTMLMGDPFLLDYLATIDGDMRDLGFRRIVIYKDRVSSWHLQFSSSS